MLLTGAALVMALFLLLKANALFARAVSMMEFTIDLVEGKFGKIELPHRCCGCEKCEEREDAKKSAVEN